MNKRGRKKVLRSLYIELVKLQNEIIQSKLKLLVILEGRDAAGKDGTVKTIMAHLSPRETKVVALGAPSNRQEKEWYFQRFIAHLPISGEFVIFNRSWYNRAGVEKVMGFCSPEQYRNFFRDVGKFEKMLVSSGFIILKYYLDISKKEQKKRLDDRKTNPLKQWKVSQIDLVAQKHWNDYSQARNKMLKKTNFKHSPWFIVNSEEKGKAHIALISHLLGRVNYRNKKEMPAILANDRVYFASAKNRKTKLY